MINRNDVLARHKEMTGFLRGKILSDFTLTVPKEIKLRKFVRFALPQHDEDFKRFCQMKHEMGFKEKQRFPASVLSFISSGYRGNPNIGGLLFEVVEFALGEIHFATDAPGHLDAS